jgi:hypothetical protein
MNDATVNLWGRRIGAVTWVPERGVGIFRLRNKFSVNSVRYIIAEPLMGI